MIHHALPSLFEKLPSGASQSYINLRKPPGENAAKCRAYINDLWTRFSPYADVHFPQEFAVNTHQRFWEMYLGVALLQAGHTITAPKPGPDFGLTIGGRCIWIEVVAPTSGMPGNPDSIPQLKSQEGRISSGYVPQDKIVLRCTSAIAAKFPTQYQKHLKEGIVRPDDCYVIAINHAETYPFVDVGTPPYMLRAVLGLGSHFVTIDRNSGNIVDKGVQYRGGIPKSNGSNVETRLFLSPESAPVSAVIGSVITIGTPAHLAKHEIGQDFRLIHNPLARNALPSGLFVRGQEVRVLLREGKFEISEQELSG